MPDFDAWFKQRAGESVPACQWFKAFINTDDANEVVQLFKQHQAILVADEMVEELERIIRIMDRRIDQLRAENPLMQDRQALYTIWKASDRLSLIKDTRQYGLAEAVRRYQQRSQQPR